MGSLALIAVSDVFLSFHLLRPLLPPPTPCTDIEKDNTLKSTIAEKDCSRVTTHKVRHLHDKPGPLLLGIQNASHLGLA